MLCCYILKGKVTVSSETRPSTQMKNVPTAAGALAQARHAYGTKEAVPVGMACYRKKTWHTVYAEEPKERNVFPSFICYGAGPTCRPVAKKFCLMGAGRGAEFVAWATEKGYVGRLFDVNCTQHWLWNCPKAFFDWFPHYTERKDGFI